MKRKPWPIIILAIINLLAPSVYLIKSFLVSHLPLGLYLRAIFLPENIIQTLHFIVPSIILAYAIYAVKKWSYFLFIFVLGWILGRNIYNFSIEHTVSILQLVVALGFNFLIVSYFLLPAIRAAYFNPRLRWWENKPRFKQQLPLQVKQEGRLYEGSISDISVGGIFCFFNDASAVINREQNLQLIFADDTFHFTINAKAVYYHSARSGYGIQFTNVDKNQQKLLNSYILYLQKLQVPCTNPPEIWTEDFINWAQQLPATWKKHLDQGVSFLAHLFNQRKENTP